MRKERYMNILGGYKLDMHNHGHLVRDALPHRESGKDYGADPIGDGTFRMVPSGDIVDFDERERRLNALFTENEEELAALEEAAGENQ